MGREKYAVLFAIMLVVGLMFLNAPQAEPIHVTKAVSGNVSVNVTATVPEEEAPPTEGPSPAAAPVAAAGPPAPSLDVDTTDPISVNITGKNLDAGEYEADISDSELGISKMIFSLDNDTSYFRIIVKKIDRPSYVAPKEENYQYISIDIEGTVPEDFSGIRLDLRVEKTWIQANRIDADRIFFSRWNGGWQEIGISKAREDPSYVYYTASVQSFSIFAISGEKVPIVAVPMPALPAVQISTLLNELNTLILTYPLLLTMLGLGLVLLFILMLYGDKIKKKIRRLEIIELLKNLMGKKKRKK